MEIPGRLYLCAACRVQVLVCSYCDRGQIYCNGKCARQARSAAMRAAGNRYQRSRTGRFNHAARSRRYRERLQKVTHQGSPPAPPSALLMSNAQTSIQPSFKSNLAAPACLRCSFCGRTQPEFVRTGPLRHRVRRIACKPDRKGIDDGHFP